MSLKSTGRRSGDPDRVLDEYVTILGAFYFDLKDELERRRVPSSSARRPRPRSLLPPDVRLLGAALPVAAMRDTRYSDLTLDMLVSVLADEGPNDQQLVALAEVVRRASRAEDLMIALEQVRDNLGVPDETYPASVAHAYEIATDALARHRGKP